MLKRVLKAMANSQEKAVLMSKPRAEAHALPIANSVVALLPDYFEFRYLTTGAKLACGAAPRWSAVSKSTSRASASTSARAPLLPGAKQAAASAPPPRRLPRRG